MRCVPNEVVPILRVADADRAVEWYGRLGFVREWEHRFSADQPAFVCISRGYAHLYLSEHEGDASPDTLVYLRLANLDAIAELLGTEITEVPWGRELHVKDLDGNRLRIADPLHD